MLGLGYQDFRPLGLLVARAEDHLLKQELLACQQAVQEAKSASSSEWAAASERTERATPAAAGVSTGRSWGAFTIGGEGALWRKQGAYVRLIGQIIDEPNRASLIACPPKKTTNKKSTKTNRAFWLSG